MYYYNSYIQEAVVELGYVVNGGITPDGNKIEKVNLVPGNVRIAEYYYTYGSALAKLNRCGEALQITQEIRLRLSDDKAANEAADAIVGLCEQNLVKTPIPTPTLAESASPAPASTP
jgi:hypothetical protein